MTAPNWVLFLDDERTPPKSKDVWEKEVVHAKNSVEFIAAIKERGEPFMIMFDWYLGGGQPTGLDIVKWLVEYDEEANILTEDLFFDSQSSDKTKAREIVRLLGDYLARKFSKDDVDDVVRAARKRVISTDTVRKPPHLRRF